MSYWIFGGDVLPPDDLPIIGKRVSCLLNSADKVFLNLECPIIQVSRAKSFLLNPIKFILVALDREQTISCTKQSFMKLNQVIKNVTWAFAGNHTRDYGNWGVVSSLKVLADYDHFGLGDDDFYKILQLGDSRILVFNVNLVKQRIGNVSLNTYNERWGRQGSKNLSDVINIIKDKAIDCEAVIAYVHMGKCGKEEIQELDMQALKDFNDDINLESKPFIVVGHHAHQYGEVSYDKEDNLIVVGGLGNFVFDEKLGKFNESFHYNYLLKLIAMNDSLHIELVPIYVDDGNVKIIDHKRFPDGGANNLHYDIKL